MIRRLIILLLIVGCGSKSNEDKFIGEWEVFKIEDGIDTSDMSWVINEDKTIIVKSQSLGSKTKKWTINNSANKFIMHWDTDRSFDYHFRFKGSNKVCLGFGDKINLDDCVSYLERVRI